MFLEGDKYAKSTSESWKELDRHRHQEASSACQEDVNPSCSKEAGANEGVGGGKGQRRRDFI